MALSKEAAAIKAAMQQAVAIKREVEELDREWQDLLLCEEERCSELTDGEIPLVEELLRERQGLRKSLAVRQLRNLAWLGQVTLTPFERRVMRLRYVQCRTWSDTVETVQKTKQYVLRVHNRVLEKLAAKNCRETT